MAITQWQLASALWSWNWTLHPGSLASAQQRLLTAWDKSAVAALGLLPLAAEMTRREVRSYHRRVTANAQRLRLERKPTNQQAVSLQPCRGNGPIKGSATARWRPDTRAPVPLRPLFPLELTLNGTQRRRQRPQDTIRQQAHYSGKKKTHTDKNLLLVNETSGKVSYLSPTVAGRIHDKRAADEASIAYPANTTLDQGTGFVAVADGAVIWECEAK